MQAIRMLISTATILAATAVAWQGGPSAGAQEPKSPGGEPGAAKGVRLFFGKDAQVTAGGDVRVIVADEPDKLQAPAGGAREIRKEVRVIRGQEADAAKTTDETIKAQVRGRVGALRLRHIDDEEDLNRVLRFREGGPNDPHREVIQKLKSMAHESCIQCHAGGVSVRQDDALGLTLVPADETLRSQLKLDGKGLVVTAVAHRSSGESGGVKEKDILIECEGKRLASVDDFREALKAIGAGPMPEVVAEMPKAIRRERIALKLVRAGEMQEVAVPPPFPPTVVVGRVASQGAANPKAPSYWIGVSIDEVDDTLRAHLKLDEKVGLVVSDVLKESPAVKVGLEKNDVLLAADGKPLKAPDDLVKAVQASKGAASLKLRIRRAGDERWVTVRPEKRNDPEPAAAAVPLLGYKEIKVGDGSPTWVAQIVPFLDVKQAQIIWATPKPDGHIFVQRGQMPQPAPPGGLITLDLKNQPGEVSKKAAEAETGKLAAYYERLFAELRSQEAWRKAVAESVNKVAVTGETLGRIDAQLKSLEAQVGEIKRSMDELKAAIKKEK